MKKIIGLTLASILISVSATFGQASKKVNWAEMKAFHSFISTTFHPVEEGNFAPLKQKADSLEITAKQWQSSTIPSNYKPAETKEALAKLVTKTSQLNKAVKANESDDNLKKLITETHDIFHHIVGECKKGDE